jgi:hypothetical protein
MTRLPVRALLAAVCCLLLAATPGAAQTAEHLANVHVVKTEGPVAHPDGTVYFTDLASDRIVKLGADGLIATYRQPANRPNGLRLDVQEGPFADRGEFGGPVIVAGNAGESLLIHRVTASDLTRRMPYRRGFESPVMPGLEDDRLTDEEIETLRLWIDQGAEWQAHWAFIPPERPLLPPVADGDWVRNPIDRFVLARLEADGVAPSSEADRTTLLRRVTLDLTGLRIGAMATPTWLLPQVEPIYAAALDLLRQLGTRMADGLAAEVEDWGAQEVLALKTEFRMGLEFFLSVQTVEPPFRTLDELIDFNFRNADDVMPLFGQELLLAAAKTEPSDPDYAKAVEDLARLCRDQYLLHLLDSHGLDVLVAPTSNPTTLVDHVHGSRAKGGSLISPAAVAGFPHVTVPMGLVQHLPVGLSFVGRPFSEPMLLRVADCFERSLNLSIEPQFIDALEAWPQSAGQA